MEGKEITRTGVFRMARLLIFAVIILCITKRLEYILRPTDTDLAMNAIDTFHDMPNDTFEVIGYGSSHIWRGFAPMEMYDAYGIGAYNYGCNWQHVNTTQLFIKDSLKTQTPKVVLIETFRISSLEYDEDMNGEIYYTRAIDNGTAKQRYLKQCFGDDRERYLSYYAPLYAFHENWRNLAEESFRKDYSETGDFYKTMGFVASDKVTPIDIPDQSGASQKELSEKAIKIVDDIVEICKEKEIDVVFYTAPYQATYPYSDAMKKYAAENGCQYFNLFEYIDEMGIDVNTDFSDKNHLNTSGAVKVADFLGGYLVNNYDLTDFRSVEDNIWEKH